MKFMKWWRSERVANQVRGGRPEHEPLESLTRCWSDRQQKNFSNQEWDTVCLFNRCSACLCWLPFQNRFIYLTYYILCYFAKQLLSYLPDCCWARCCRLLLTQSLMWPRFGFKLLCLKVRPLNIWNTAVLLFAKCLLSPSIMVNHDWRSLFCIVWIAKIAKSWSPQRTNPALAFCGNCVGDDYIVKRKVMFTWSKLEFWKKKSTWKYAFEYHLEV